MNDRFTAPDPLAALRPPKAKAPSEALACGNCKRAMRRLALAAHYGRSVELDLCDACDLVWFDRTETATLAGGGLLALIGEMASAYAVPHEVLRADAACPRCGGATKTVHNRSRWGRSLQLECRTGHGALQSFEQFLHEKGLLRPMSRTDRARLLAERGRIDCVNCGAAVGGDDARCSYCGTAPALLDVARLAQALDPEGAIAPQDVHARRATTTSLGCAACGAAIGEAALRCPSCGVVLAVPSLVEAHRAVAALAPALRAHAERPAPEVVRRRLDVLAADMPRRRAWVDDLRRSSADSDDGDDDEPAFGTGATPGRRVARAAWLGGLAVVLWWLWR